jgi:hypothetical protein
MKRFEEIQELNSDLLKMVDFTAPLWNGGARFWLEHRGPALARALAEAPGLKLWVQAPPIGDLEAVLKLSALLGDHVIVGHCGPLPPYHFGLAFPWRLDESSEIPPSPSEVAKATGKPFAYQLRVDAVRRPLPPASKQCLLGSVREAIRLGLMTYFPASIVYAPLEGKPWPSPAEVLEREGRLPTEHRLIGVKQPPESVEPDAASQADTPRKSAASSEGDLGWTIGDQGYPEFSDPRIPRLWEWSQDAVHWELLFSSLIASGGLQAETMPARNIERIPDAVLRLEFPYLRSAQWEAILELREKESSALEGFRASLMAACSKVNDERGSKRFEKAVEDIQHRLIDRGLDDVRKSFRSHRVRQWAKVAGLGITFAALEVACYLGLPPLTALLGHAAVGTGGIHLALDLTKEEKEWRKRARTEMPMYFLWRLRKAQTPRA